jgi:hypothetical protein
VEVDHIQPSCRSLVEDSTVERLAEAAVVRLAGLGRGLLDSEKHARAADLDRTRRERRSSVGEHLQGIDDPLRLCREMLSEWLLAQFLRDRHRGENGRQDRYRRAERGNEARQMVELPPEGADRDVERPDFGPVLGIYYRRVHNLCDATRCNLAKIRNHPPILDAVQAIRHALHEVEIEISGECDGGGCEFRRIEIRPRKVGPKGICGAVRPVSAKGRFDASALTEAHDSTQWPGRTSVRCCPS